MVLDKLYFHIGCTYSKDFEINRLHSLGYKIIILDDVGIRSSQQICYDYYLISNLKIEGVIELIHQSIDREKKALGLLFTFADGSVNLLNKLCHRLGVEPVSQFKDIDLRNKYMTRKRLEKFGYKLPICFRIFSPKDIPPLKDTDFPLIVKPVDSMDSRMVYKTNNMEQLIHACETVLTKNKTFVPTDNGTIILEENYHQENAVLVETFIAGREISVEAIAIKGELVFWSPTYKHDYIEDFFCERGNSVGADFLSEKEKISIVKYLEDIIKANQFYSTPFHVEFFLTKNETAELIEVNSRIAGVQIPNLIFQSCDEDLMSLFFDGVQRTNCSKLRNLKMKRIATSFEFYTNKEGKLRILNSTFNENKVNWLYCDGQKIKKFSTARFSRVGIIFYENKTFNEAKNTFDVLRKKQTDFFEVV